MAFFTGISHQDSKPEFGLPCIFSVTFRDDSLSKIAGLHYPTNRHALFLRAWETTDFAPSPSARVSRFFARFTICRSKPDFCHETCEVWSSDTSILLSMLSRSPQTVSLDTSISFLRPYHCIPSTITLCISPCWHLLISDYPFHSTVLGGFPDTGVEMLKSLRLHLSLHYLYQVSRCNIQVIVLSRSALLTVCRVSRSCSPDLLSGIILVCIMFH